MDNRNKCVVTGKNAYASRREAGIALHCVKRRRGGFLSEQSTYHCRYCNSWHLTKLPPSTKPAFLKPRSCAPVKRKHCRVLAYSDEEE